MGTWGTSLTDDDTYLDIYSEFFTLYNKGHEVNEITEFLIEDNQEIIVDEENPDHNSFWFALAKAQWECKGLTDEVYKKVKYIIDNDVDLSNWDDSDKVKRQKALKKFQEQISTQKLKAKARARKKSPQFRKGDCITFKLANGNYGGVVILEALNDEESELSWNLAAATRINMPDKPDLNDFNNSEVLVTNFEFENDKQAFQQICWLSSHNRNKLKNITEIIGQIEVAYNFNPAKNYGSSNPSFGWFEMITEVVPKQYKSEETKPKYKDIKTIKELTQNATWRYW